LTGTVKTEFCGALWMGTPSKALMKLNSHHIAPFSEGGSTDIDNIAPVCKEHDKRIRTLSLQEFRDKSNLDRFFEDGFKKTDGVRLDDILIFELGEN